MGDRDVVVHLHRVLVLQTEIEPLPQKRKKSAADLCPREGNAKGVVRTARHHPLAAQPGEKRIFDRVRVPVGDAKREEDPDSVLRVAVGLQNILIEGIGRRPAAALAVGGLRGNEQLREGLRENALRDRSGIAQAWKPLLQQCRGKVGGIPLGSTKVRRASIK